MKRSTIYISVSLALSVGLLLALLWLLGGGIGLSAFTARAAEPAGPTAPGDVYCVTLAGGGPYPGCDQVFTSVQAAVDAASGGEVIKVAAGTYTGVQGRPAPVGYNGPSVITQVVYISESVTIQGGYTTTDWTASYPITQPTTLDAQGQGRVIFITGDISPTVEGLRITAGDAAGLGAADGGGGVYVVTATATIRNSQVFSNTASNGGGLYLYQSAATLNGNTISSNTLPGWLGYGGGLYLDWSDATLTRNTVSANTANYEGGGLYIFASNAVLGGNTVFSNTAQGGGGLSLVWSDTVLSGNTIAGNTAQGNGGLFIGSGTNTTLSNNTIIANIANAGDGGGLGAYWGESLTLTGNTISGNTATGDGGGLYLSFDSTLTGNTISSNTAGESGGGLYIFDADAALVSNVIVDNVGGGIYIKASSAHLLHTTIARNVGSGVDIAHVGYDYSTVTLTNTVLVSQSLGIGVGYLSSARLEGTLWGSGAWANETDWGGAGTTVTGTVNYWGDPDFVDPDNGDYHIGPSSAALDRGVDAEVSTDIDNEPRFYGDPDLGADEYWPPGALKRVYLPLVLRNH